MKNKRFFRSFIVMLAALVVLGGFSVTAYAYSGEETGEETTVQTEAEGAGGQRSTGTGRRNHGRRGAAAIHAGGQYEPCR